MYSPAGQAPAVEGAIVAAVIIFPYVSSDRHPEARALVENLVRLLRRLIVFHHNNMRNRRYRTNPTQPYPLMTHAPDREIYMNAPTTINVAITTGGNSQLLGLISGLKLVET